MAFIYKKEENNIVTLTIDMVGQTTNVINESYSMSLLEAVQKLEKESDLVGVIITSAKKTFLARADFKIFYQQNDPKACYDLVESGKAITRRLELLGKPVVAAVNGTALGGGMELTMCCHYRVALDIPNVKFGFPEVNLGILPGGGGVARLPRMIGIEASLPFLIEGRQVTAAGAVKAGLMDELATSFDDMMEKSKQWIYNNAEHRQPWDKNGYNIPKGSPSSDVISKVLDSMSKTIRKKTRGNYPAPEAILKAIKEGSLVDFEKASIIESKYFVELVTGQVSKNIMKSMWFQLNEINAGASRPKGIEQTKTSKVGVIGSGLMGHGIAYVTALAGMEVVMTDISQVKADKGLSRIKKIFNGGLKRGLLTEQKMNESLKKIIATEDLSKLSGCDLIIEAVFEDSELKANVTAKAEKYLDTNGVFASNTSTIPITSLADKSVRPEKFIGIHFFSPVHKMKLVEIIKGEKTDAYTMAKAFDYVLKIKKVPIVVNDRRGFYTTRVFERYTGEGMALLAEGNSAEKIEAAGIQAGYPVGPLAVIDEINISLAAHIRDQTWRDLKAEGKDLPTGPWDKVIDFMTKEVHRSGRASGGGFYEYPQDGKKYLWPELKNHFPLSDNPLEEKEMIDRFHFLQAIETIRCYEEGVLTTVADANIGSILGWGFPSFKGGTLQFVTDYGIQEFKNRAEELMDSYGDRFEPPKLLNTMIEENESF